MTLQIIDQLRFNLRYSTWIENIRGAWLRLAFFPTSQKRWPKA